MDQKSKGFYVLMSCPVCGRHVLCCNHTFSVTLPHVKVHTITVNPQADPANQPGPTSTPEKENVEKTKAK
jgi:hypothetical protein